MVAGFENLCRRYGSREGTSPSPAPLHCDDGPKCNLSLLKFCRTICHAESWLGAGGSLRGPLSSACARSRQPRSRGGLEWGSGMRLRVVRGGCPPPPASMKLPQRNLLAARERLVTEPMS